MVRIEAVCLGHKETFPGNYQTIQELKSAIFAKYRKYFVKKNVKEIPINFILTYMNKKTDTEEVLFDINTIKRHDDQWFQLSVKRIWDECCACLRQFAITPGQIPCECQNSDCGYQYCYDCVQIIKRLSQNNNKIYCIYCGKSSSEGPKPNRLLSDLLWEQYMVKYGVESLPMTNIMPGTLSNDIECRLIHLKSLIQTLQANLNQNISIPKPIDSDINHANMLIMELEKIQEETEKFLLTVVDDIDDNKLNDYLNEYIKLLTGNRYNNRKCEYFISICEQLLYYNQKAEFEKYFPLLNNKMNEWEYSSNIEEQIQPKIMDVFKAIQSDLGYHIIPTIPCRIGFIGNISVAKSSILNWLRGVRSKYEVDENSQNITASDNTLVSPVRVGKSTYCRLEFEHEYINGKKFIFVDIEGSTDTDTCLKSANYFDEILKADCDLYIIVFDDQFTDIQQEWYDFIVNNLDRQCWLVRSKVDRLFRDMFKEDIRQDFDLATDAARNKYAERIIERIRHKVSFDIHGKNLSDVYLTFTSYDKILSQMPYSKFDLEKLINDIQNLSLSLYANRLQRMSVHAIARVINNCFRRPFVVNVMKYNVAAGIAAVIPFGELIPRYYGREKIRQEFGVNTRSRLMNWWGGTTDEFKDYLKEFDITVDESDFKTSAFKKTFQNNSVNLKTTAKVMASGVGKGAMFFGVAGVSVTDDVLRTGGFVAINTVRGLSTSLIVVGAVLTVGMCAWAAVSNGKQMHNYFNRLCDDLILVSDYVTAKIIADNDAIRDLYSQTE